MSSGIMVAYFQRRGPEEDAMADPLLAGVNHVALAARDVDATVDFYAGFQDFAYDRVVGAAGR